ncbi:hypothetical protein C7S18_22535 [Ahniella affigens]|uniref:Serine kinase n=1 Tax=Ahniella affigens TaxID=2021234 RepID=A0A2P1PY82_9GAMM|nr:hypothetical protein [Ahniella affigens]AVP99780.1 hypothetical protein C7S18_22535 [Ahniella affigens]
MFWLIDRGRSGSSLFVHDIAGQPVACPWPLWASAQPIAAPNIPFEFAEPTRYLRCDAQLGGRTRALTFGENGGGQTVVRFDHGLELWISDAIVVAQVSQTTAQGDVQEALLGPGLLSLLATKGLFALHASAISGPFGLDLLLGPSGQGKSTLARVASQQGWARYADDLVVLNSAGEFAGPFPQLKLNPPFLQGPNQPTLGRLLWPEYHAGPPGLVALPPAEVRKRLIRDSVAALIFAPAQLSLHLNWVSRLSQTVPGFRLCRPHVDIDTMPLATADALSVLRTER